VTAGRTDADLDADLDADGAASRPATPDRRRTVQRLLAAGLVVAAVLLAAASGHSAGRVQGRADGAREALASSRLLVWFRGDATADGPGRARVQLFAATGSGRATTVLEVRVGPDTLTPVAPLDVPAATSASTTVSAQVACGSDRELELVRAGPGADRLGVAEADVVDPGGTRRTTPVALLPDDAAFRTLLRTAACPAEDGSGATVPGLAVTAMTAQPNGTLTITLAGGPRTPVTRVRVVAQRPEGAWAVRTAPTTALTLRPGGPPATVTVILEPLGCGSGLVGLPSVENLLVLEVEAPGLRSRTRLPGWDESAVGQASAVALARTCGG
jgi:hypothetical protein